MIISLHLNVFYIYFIKLNLIVSLDNKINGLALESLTHEILFFELGIYSYEDRSAILYHLNKLTGKNCVCHSFLTNNTYN
jgi:hypothetical protein